MAGSEQPKPKWLDRLREKRRERKERAVERARMRPDVESSAERALYRQGGERGRASDRKF